MALKIASDKKQLGQTLIETLVAIFILVTGLFTALGLANYSFQSTDNSSKQIIGTSLARQGVEAIKNIRDSNWLLYPATTCTYGTSTQTCRTQWLTGLNQGSYAVDYNSATNTWVLSSNGPSSYALNYSSASNQYLSQANFFGVGSPTIYSRKVILSYDTSYPYNLANNQRLIVVSTVWWTSRQCAATNDPTGLPASCKVILEMHLTNWRNY